MRFNHPRPVNAPPSPPIPHRDSCWITNVNTNLDAPPPPSPSSFSRRPVPDLLHGQVQGRGVFRVDRGGKRREARGQGQLRRREGTHPGEVGGAAPRRLRPFLLDLRPFPFLLFLLHLAQEGRPRAAVGAFRVRPHRPQGDRSLEGSCGARWAAEPGVGPADGEEERSGATGNGADLGAVTRRWRRGLGSSSVKGCRRWRRWCLC